MRSSLRIRWRFNMLSDLAAAWMPQVAVWIADKYFQDAWQLVPDREAREQKGQTYQDLYRERMNAMAAITATILSSPNVHHVNLDDEDGSKKLVDQLVRLDRLPRETPIEGLLLMQEAWCAYDVAMHLADRYKGISKLIFFLQLLLIFAVMVATALAALSCPWAGESEAYRQLGSMELAAATSTSLNFLHSMTAIPRASYVNLAFILSAFASVLISVDSVINAKLRWRQLRNGAGTLETYLWCYRTRVGSFELDQNSDSRSSELALCNALIRWRQEIVSGGDLQVSGFGQAYPEYIYKHAQNTGILPDGEDDHHSPVQPQKYVDLRIIPSIAFYPDRIPKYAMVRDVLRMMLLTSTGLSTLCAHYQLIMPVVIITGFAGAVTSWQEFADVSRKTERYTRAMFQLQNMLSWWKSLSEVERASKEIISQLIHTSEGIISEERVAWVSTASKQVEENGSSSSPSKKSIKARRGDDDLNA